jgi:hypothetical protein
MLHPRMGSWFAFWCASSALVASACGSSDSSLMGAGAGEPTATATSSSSSTGVGGGLLGTCDPACPDGKFCSATNQCIDKGSCAHKDDCGMGLTCDLSTKKCVPGGECGNQEEAITAVPPNLLIVLDRSCSMTSKVGSDTKWTLAVAAINKMTMKFANKVRFGITLFPDTVTPNCDQDKIPIPPGPNNETKVGTLLTNALMKTDPLFPNGPCVTNIETAMKQAQGEPAFKDMTRDNYAMLITDGAETCGKDAVTATIIANMLKAKVKTFVVGFLAGSDSVSLNSFADAGGTPTGDPKTHYYNAADGATLEKALDAIAKLTLSCTFALDKTPSDPNKLFVFFDNASPGVPRDPTHMSGWDYDPKTNSITFYGKYCTDLQAGKIADVDIVFGCNAPTPN